MQAPGSDKAPTERLICASGDVDVWRVALDCSPTDLIAFEAALSSTERVRASKFATEELRRRWIAARGALRMILAAYLGVSPGSLVLTSDANGKPKLAKVDSAVFFNLTHSAHLAFVAISARKSVGIDAEILRTDIVWEEISSRFFARVEADEIRSLAPEWRNAAFFACWTRKEAYLKAIGIGLHAALDKFQMSVQPDDPRLLWVEGNSDEPRRWSIHDLTEPDVAVALAVKSSKPAVVRRFVFSVPLVSMRSIQEVLCPPVVGKI
jgi:4'-phosphopantetheinyl transferase